MKIIKKIYIPILFFLIGILIVFYPVIFINNELMPGDLGDGRFINYVLEHFYLFLSGSKLHNSFWNLPFFYPYTNTLSYSDIMFGGMILYAPIRFFVDSPQTALQIWLFFACLFNFLSAYLLFKKALNFNNFLSSFAAFFIAFSIARYNQIYHLQLYTQFYMLFSFAAFFALRKTNSKLKNNLLFLSGTLMFVMQLYTSFYFGWYMVYALVLFSFLMMFFKESRNMLKNFILFYKKEILIYSFISLILLLPLLYHYLSLHVKQYYYAWLLIKPWHIFKTKNLIYSIFFDIFNVSSDRVIELENTVGVGIFALCFSLWGLFKNKYGKYFLLFILVSLILFGFEIVNCLLYLFFPGASAIRAAGRVVYLFLPLYAFGIVFLVTKLKNKLLIATIIILSIIEQIPVLNGYNFEWNKSQHNKRLEMYSKVPEKCNVVHFDTNDKSLKSEEFVYLLDMIWYASNNNKYTTNGYSGYFPDNNAVIMTLPDECFLKIEN